MDRLICAPESLAQSVLVALCDDTRIQTRALKYLGELEDYASRRATANKNTTTTTTAKNNNNNNNKNDDQGDKGGSSANSNPLKRRKPMEPGQICLQCKHAFIPSGNAAKACLYHPGELDLDEEHSTWDDWDKDVGGPHDSPENREDHPEGFVWGEYCLLFDMHKSLVYLSTPLLRNLTILATNPGHAHSQIVVTETVCSQGAQGVITWPSGEPSPRSSGLGCRLKMIS